MKTVAFTVAVLAAMCAAPVAHSAEVQPACTPEQLQAAQAAIDQKLIQSSCPEMVYVNGNPDYKDVAYCLNDGCVQAIKKTKKALPKCSYNGENVRKGTNKLAKTCDKLAGSGDDNDDTDDASATPSSKTPKPSKTPKTPTAATATPTPAPANDDDVGKVIGAADDSSSLGPEIGTPIGTPPATTTEAPVTPTPTATSAPSISTSSTSGAGSDRVATATMLAVIATSFVWAALA